MAPSRKSLGLTPNGSSFTSVEHERGLQAIHLVSHSAPGELLLGAGTLDASNLGCYGDELATIGASLEAGGGILLYGCEVAKGAAGRAFIGRLAEVAGAHVAASRTPVGCAAACARPGVTTANAPG